jgi:hypothetical protein
MVGTGFDPMISEHLPCTIDHLSDPVSLQVAPFPPVSPISRELKQKGLPK